MKVSNFYASFILSRRSAKICLAALTVVLVGLAKETNLGRAQQYDDRQGEQVLTRGPVHEAFAGIVTYTPEPGVLVTKTPPEPIEEVPPEERPEGDNVAWIPGYWAWDDERNDFLWISGTWRALPPGRQWIAGYWAQASQGYQWTSGYWADAAAQVTTYLPPPPRTVEVGPSIVAPSPDYIWIPGCWIWYRGHYAWRPGYWVLGRDDWDWCPSHYVWTPRGCVYVEGFWDYSVERRGVLFAPVYFENRFYARRGYYYSPRIVINLDLFPDHLFVRPRYCHYYFGDYYSPRYVQSGFFASFSFHFGHQGYDPIYNHERWRHRGDRDWERHVQTSYQYRRDNESARPPHTWTAQRSIDGRTSASRENRVMVAAPIDQWSKRQDSTMRFQPVPSAERQQLTQRSQEVQRSREQRRTVESRPVSTAQQSGEIVEPAKAQLPRSPIVAKSIDQLGKNHAPPRAPSAPKPDTKLQGRPETSRPLTDASPTRSQRVEPRQLEPEKRAAPSRSERAPGREEVATPRQIQPESQPRVLQPEPKTQDQLRRTPRDEERKIQPDVKRQPDVQPQRGNDRKPEVQRPPQIQRQPELQRQPDAQRIETQQRPNEAAARSQEEARRAKETQTRALEKSQERARQTERATQESQQRIDAAARSQEESRRTKESSSRPPQPLQRSPKEMERTPRVIAPQRGNTAEQEIRENPGTRANPGQITVEKRGSESARKIQKQKEKDKDRP